MVSFRCENCRELRHASEQAPITLPAKFGVILITRAWWPSEICAACARQVSTFGWLGIVGAVVAGVLLLMWLLVSAMVSAA